MQDRVLTACTTTAPSLLRNPLYWNAWGSISQCVRVFWQEYSLNAHTTCSCVSQVACSLGCIMIAYLVWCFQNNLVDKQQAGNKTECAWLAKLFLLRKLAVSVFRKHQQQQSGIVRVLLYKTDALDWCRAAGSDRDAPPASEQDIVTVKYIQQCQARRLTLALWCVARRPWYSALCCCQPSWWDKTLFKSDELPTFFKCKTCRRCTFAFLMNVE